MECAMSDIKTESVSLHLPRKEEPVHEVNSQHPETKSDGGLRRSIPQRIVMDVVDAADHMCCVCRAPAAGLHIHHIDEDSDNNDPSNLAVLCFDHHSLAHTRGGFGRRLDARLITYHRDTWNAAVRHRRGTASEPAVRAIETPLLLFLKEVLTIDFSWEGPFRGEFGEFSALEDEAYFQLPGRESLKTKPRLFHTYWGLLGSKQITPELFKKQAVSAARRLADRLAAGRWVETHIPDYQASPIEGIRAVRSVRHTAKAASILLLVDRDNGLAAEILWGLIDAMDSIVNPDGGCCEELAEQPSSLYASAYMLQLLSEALANPRLPSYLPEFKRWSKSARELLESLHRYMASTWEATRWNWGDTPWQVNAPYIGVDVGPWLRPDLRAKVSAVMLDELSPVGRLMDPQIGDSFGAPELLRALRTAYALQSIDGAETDDRLSRLRIWLLEQDWTQTRLRPCDVTFLAKLATAT
jgi:hypothetical protein